MMVNLKVNTVRQVLVAKLDIKLQLSPVVGQVNLTAIMYTYKPGGQRRAHTLFIWFLYQRLLSKAKLVDTKEKNFFLRIIFKERS